MSIVMDYMDGSQGEVNQIHDAEFYSRLNCDEAANEDGPMAIGSLLEPPDDCGGMQPQYSDWFGNIDDISAIADESPIEWIIANWFMLRGLHMLTGHSFAGKSLLVSDLVARVSQGIQFGNLDCVQTPVLIIDAENHESITKRRIQQKLPPGDVNVTWLLKHKMRDIFPLNVERVEDVLCRFYDRTGQDRCVLVVDTMRSAFGIDEQDPKEIIKLLYPLQRAAQSLNCALLLLNHRPKSNSEYAGHNAMLAALDFFAVYERDGSRGTLRMSGTRLDQPEPIQFVYDAATYSLVPQKGAGEQASDLRETIKSVIKRFPGINQENLINKVQENWSGKAPGRKRIKEGVDEMCVACVIVKSGDHGRDGYKYFIEE